MKVVIDCVFIRKVSVGSNHWLKRRNAYTFSNDSDNSMHNKQAVELREKCEDRSKPCYNVHKDWCFVMVLKQGVKVEQLGQTAWSNNLVEQLGRTTWSNNLVEQFCRTTSHN